MNAIKLLWVGLPDVVRHIASVTVGAGSSLVLIGMVLNVPNRLTAAEQANRRQDSEIVDLQRQAPRTEYLFCVDAADRGLIPDTPQDCYRRYQFRRDDQ